MKEKKITKEELVKLVRTMVKESLVQQQAALKESKAPKTQKLSVKELREMVRTTIEAVLKEETEK